MTRDRVRRGFSSAPAAGICALLAAACGPALDAQDLAFVPNRGQFPPAVAFEARGDSYSISLAGTEASLRLRSAGASLRFAGSRPDAAGEASGPQPAHSNYLIGDDPSQWRTGVPQFSRVRYRDLYPGIDLVYYGNRRQLEYDLVVSPGADPGAIRIALEGITGFEMESNGDLAVRFADSELRLRKPVVYQQIDGVRRKIAGEYVPLGGNRVGFRIGAYDRRYPLTIDPVLSYATYLGGSDNEVAYGVATDSAGNSYVTGYTSSTDFPAAGAYQTSGQGGVSDVFVAKYSSTGALVYTTYLGGNGQDTGYGIAVDQANNAYITGTTSSTNFPASNSAYSTHLNASATANAFVAVLNPDGNGLVYSTYFGGTGEDIGYGVAVDAAGEATITGSTTSTDLPIFNALRASNGGGSSDAFAARLNNAGTALVYSTYLGGSGADAGYAIALDGSGSAYVTGYTNSSNFLGVTRSANASDYDGFVTAIDANGTLIYSTFLGGTDDDYGAGIAVDANGNAVVAGTTASPDFPVTSGAVQTAPGGGYDATVTRLTPTGTIFWSTYLGGSGDDYGLAVAMDASGNAFVTGDTASTNFPATFDAVQNTLSGAFNIFAAEVNSNGASLGYSTYLGGSGFETAYGIALDSTGAAWLAGYSVSTDFATGPGAAQANLAGGSDALVMKVAGCAFSLDSPGASPLASGSIGTVNLTASPAACGWTASSTAPWLTLTTPASGTGSAAIDYSFTTNDGPPRNGALTIAGLTFMVNQAGLQAQTISFSQTAGVTYGAAPFTISATSSSSLAVSFASTTLAVCTVSGATVTIVGAGSCTIMATQQGDANYTAAPPMPQSFTVSQASQTITFGPLSGVTLGVAPFGITATASSGLVVSLASTTTSICTVSSAILTIVAAGTCSITASQAGNANYAPAANVTQSFTVAAPPTTVTLSLGDGAGVPGQTVEIAMQIATAGASTPAGFQADLNFDAAKLTFTSARAGPQTTSVGKSLTTNTLPNGDVRLLVTGLNQSSIADGIVAYASFTVNAQFTSGSTVVTPENCSSTDGSGGALATPCTAGTIRTAACDINLDGNTNVSDVQLIINEALGVAPAVHDLNGDGVVNVVDVQKVINAALGLGCILP